MPLLLLIFLRKVKNGFNIGIILTTAAPSTANIIANGDFETGSLAPWTCKQARCEVTEGFLAITERTKEWSGPLQFLPVEIFASDEQFKATFNYSIKSPLSVTANWKIKATKSGQVKYITIHSANIETDSDWKNIFSHY